MNNEAALIPIKEVIKLTGHSESTIRRYASNKDHPFPASTKITTRNVRWSRKAVIEWINDMERS